MRRASTSPPNRDRWANRSIPLAGLAFCVALGTTVQTAGAGEPLLSLLESGDLGAEFRAHDAYQVQATLRNGTDRALEIDIEPGLVLDAFAQNDIVLAQLGQLNQLGAPGGGTQGIGAFGGTGLGISSLTVPPGQTETVSLATVCLNYGIPEPSRSTRLFAKSVEDYDPDPRVHAIVRQMSRGQIPQGGAQLAVWHVTNGLSWDRLAEIGARPKFGLSPAHVRQACSWAASALAGPRLDGEIVGVAGTDDRAEPPLLHLALNPGPRGPAEGDLLVRQACRVIRETMPDCSSDHSNQPALPQTPGIARMRYSVLVRALPAREGSVRLTLLPWRLENPQSGWQPGRLETQVIDLASLPAAGDATDAERLAWAIRQTVLDDALQVRWRGGRSRITVSSLLPQAIRELTLQDAADISNIAAVEVSLPAGAADVSVALPESVSQQFGDARRLRVIGVR